MIRLLPTSFYRNALQGVQHSCPDLLLVQSNHYRMHAIPLSMAILTCIPLCCCIIFVNCKHTMQCKVLHQYCEPAFAIYTACYCRAEKFRGIQFSRMGDLQRFHVLNFADGRSRNCSAHNICLAVGYEPGEERQQLIVLSVVPA